MPHEKSIFNDVYFLRFLSMHDTFMFVELSNNISLFINNIFHSCKIILEFFCTPMCVYFARTMH
jgi:hypothetical protein